MKRLVTIIIPCLTLLACSNGKEMESKNSNEIQNKQESAYGQTFSCPMHPEVTGKEGDTCPKCGMKLEQSDNAVSSAGAYFMQFAADPSKIQPNQTVNLSFIPKKKDNPAEPVALDIEHKKKIHLILVSDDLSWFEHIHPEYTADGFYKVDTRFPTPGKYKAYADYKPTGGGQVVDQFDIDVQGTAPASTTFASEKLTGTSDNYTFTLTPSGGKLSTGSATMQGLIKKEGKVIDANTLENYLGAEAHIVVISLNEKEYLHVHPEVVNGLFNIHTTFNKPGIYRGWIQFIGDKKLHTIDFTMNVNKGRAQEKTSVDTQNHHSGHSH